jgi:hypothetical protein
VDVVRHSFDAIRELHRVRDEVALLVAAAGLLAVAVLGVVPLAE